MAKPPADREMKSGPGGVTGPPIEDWCGKVASFPEAPCGESLGNTILTVVNIG
jgi:hypothetical protein